MMHVWRKFLDVFTAQSSSSAEAAIKRIAQLYAVEKEARGKTSEERVGLRKAKAESVFDDLETWLHTQLPKISSKSPSTQAIRYALNRIPKALPYLGSGVLEFDNDTAERAVKLVTLGRKNCVFAVSQHAGKAMAIAFTLIETAKLDELVPWNYSSGSEQDAHDQKPGAVPVPQKDGFTHERTPRLYMCCFRSCSGINGLQNVSTAP